MKDAALITSKAFPAAGANNSSDGIDLSVRPTPGTITPEHAELEISWPALAALADAKNVVFTIQDSADNITFASIGITKTITGAGGAGVAAGTASFRFPKGARRYVRVNAAQDAAGGDITGSAYTVSLIVH